MLVWGHPEYVDSGLLGMGMQTKDTESLEAKLLYIAKLFRYGYFSLVFSKLGSFELALSLKNETSEVDGFEELALNAPHVAQCHIVRRGPSQ